MATAPNAAGTGLFRQPTCNAIYLAHATAMAEDKENETQQN